MNQLEKLRKELDGYIGSANMRILEKWLLENEIEDATVGIGESCSFVSGTGQDTGYISAVDKMNWTDDYTIYLRRRPLDAQGYTTAEKDETSYCTTADRKEVVDKAYEAITSGKRVILIYDTPRPFGWKKLGGCNSAPITDIKVVEE